MSIDSPKDTSIQVRDEDVMSTIIKLRQQITDWTQGIALRERAESLRITRMRILAERRTGFREITNELSIQIDALFVQAVALGIPNIRLIDVKTQFERMKAQLIDLEKQAGITSVIISPFILDPIQELTIAEPCKKIGELYNSIGQLVTSGPIDCSDLDLLFERGYTFKETADFAIVPREPTTPVNPFYRDKTTGEKIFVNEVVILNG